MLAAGLSIRGLKTMSLRMERQQANATKMADFLSAHPLVTAVNYPGRKKMMHFIYCIAPFSFCIAPYWDFV